MKKRSNYLIGFAAFLALVVIVIGWLFSELSSETKRFDNYEQAIKSGELPKGWDSSILPKDATNIIFLYNYDTSEVTMEFTSSQFFLRESKPPLAPIDTSSRPKYEKLAKETRWSLSISSGLRLYRVINTAVPATIAADPISKRVLYWEHQSR